jgi:hypothetical protein
MSFKVISCECVDWIHVAQDSDQCRAVVQAIMSLQVP